MGLLSVRVEYRLKAERHGTERALIEAFPGMGCHVFREAYLHLKNSPTNSAIESPVVAGVRFVAP